MTETPREDTPDDMARWRAFWAEVSGLPPEALVFAPPPSRWKARLSRWSWIARRMDAMECPRPPIPRNIAPWTNEPLPGLHDASRLHDRWLWLISHPGTRYETLAWHRRRRRFSLLRWRARKLRATLRARAPGAPAWLRDP